MESWFKSQSKDGKSAVKVDTLENFGTRLNDLYVRYIKRIRKERKNRKNVASSIKEYSLIMGALFYVNHLYLYFLCEREDDIATFEEKGWDWDKLWKNVQNFLEPSLRK